MNDRAKDKGGGGGHGSDKWEQEDPRQWRKILLRIAVALESMDASLKAIDSTLAKIQNPPHKATSLQVAGVQDLPRRKD